MSKFTLNRRALLRGALGTGVAIALPPLEAMVGSSQALGQVAGAKKRFMTFYMGNGVPTLGYCGGSGCTERWLPPNQGANFTLSEAMGTLAPIKQYVRVMSGLRNPHGDSISHTANMAGVMTGIKAASHEQAETKFAGATVDYIAAKTLSAGCKFSTLSAIVAKANFNAVSRDTLTFNESGAPQGSMKTSLDLFNKLFQGFTPPMAGGGAPKVDPEAVRRGNILDFVRADTKRLQSQLGAGDRARIDQHLTAIEEVQRSLQTNPTSVTSECKLPGAPAAGNPGDLRIKSRQMLDLIVLAFACDLTRVFAFAPVGCNGENALSWLYPGNLHDETSHAKIVSESEVLVRMSKVVQWELGELTYLVQKLQGIPEGTGTMFDNTLIVTASEHGNSNNHSPTDIPMVAVAGSKIGITGNYHWRASGAPQPSTANPSKFTQSTSQMWFSVLQKLGVPVANFGGETGTLPLV
jgi:hypothetical protein